jgi:hypothetical protein
VLIFTKRPGRRAEVRFMPGCLVWSLLLSIGLTILLNVRSGCSEREAALRPGRAGALSRRFERPDEGVLADAVVE